MRIAGLEKHSFVDYPGKLAAVIFTPGCNLDCYYCHNRQLIAPGEHPARIDPQDVLEFLDFRAGLLDGVVISGGEPTLQGGLLEFCESVKALGYPLKLDTNGTRPWVLREAIDRGLVDYVAMDVKAPLSRYAEITRCETDTSAVAESIDLLLSGGVDGEFRTTFAPTLGVSDILAVAARISGAKRYAIQQYRTPGRGMDLFGVTEAPPPHDEAVLRRAAELSGRFVGEVVLRGLSSPQPAEAAMSEADAYQPSSDHRSEHVA